MKHKTLLLYTLLFFLPHIAIHSQNISLGLHPGLHISSWEIDDSEEALLQLDAQNRLGTRMNLFISFELAPSFLIQMEGSVIEKGMKSVFEIPDFEEFPFDDQEIHFVFNYIEVPILFKYRFLDKKLKASVFGGSSFGYAMSGYTQFDNVKQDIEFEKDDGFRRHEVSVIGGFNIGVELGKGELFFDTRYQRGITNLNEDSENGIIMNKGFSLGLGYAFKLNKE